MTAATTTAASRLSAFGVRSSYSPKCLEGVFYELRRDGVLGSSPTRTESLMESLMPTFM